MRASNPPKLMRLVNSVLTGVKLDEKELAALDYHSDFTKKKKQAEEDKKNENKSVEDGEAVYDEAVPRVILAVALRFANHSIGLHCCFFARLDDFCHDSSDL